MNHLATIKLAIGLLERRGHLTAAEHTLAETAIHAADAIVADLAAGRVTVKEPEAPHPSRHVS
jgi:hypothetical protein